MSCIAATRMVKRLSTLSLKFKISSSSYATAYHERERIFCKVVEFVTRKSLVSVVVSRFGRVDRLTIGGPDHGGGENYTSRV